MGLCSSLDLSTVSAYGPPLVEAAAKNDSSTVQGLLQQGEDPNLAGFDGATALVHAIRHQNVDMIRSLLVKGADLKAANRDGNLLGISGTAISNPTILGLFLDHGLQVNTSAMNGQTLLMIVCRNGGTQAAQLLLSRGADIHAQDKTGMNALHHAVEGYGNKATIAQLLSSGAKVNHATADGTTALLEAARKGRADFVDMLIQNGADINAKNERGETALITAAQMGHISATRSLLSHGANVSVKRKGDGATALSIAERMHNRSLLELLHEVH
jgi:ankyrin repeat protein